MCFFYFTILLYINILFAVKVSGCMDSVIEAKHVIREIRLMRCLGLHPNIIGLRDAYRSASRKDIYFVLDFMDSDLHRVIQSPQPLSDSHHKHFIFQVYLFSLRTDFIILFFFPFSFFLFKFHFLIALIYSYSMQ